MRNTIFPLLVFYVTVLPAMDGATPIWEAMDIDQPGKYVLTRNLTATTGPVLNVTADDVSVDLNGFRIEVTGGGNIIAGAGADRLVVQNGTLTGGSKGFFGGGQGRTFRRLNVVSTTGIDLSNGKNDAVEECFLVTSSLGVNMNTCTQCRVVDNRIENAGQGVRIFDSGTGVLVEGNVVRDYTSAGLDLTSCTACRVIGNTLTGTGHGIQIEGVGSLIEGNTVTGGIPTTGCLRDMHPGRGNRYVGNVVTECEVGMLVQGDRNHLEANLFSDNTGWGLRFAGGSQGNVYRGNTARGNGGISCSGTASGAEFCDDNGSPPFNDSRGDNFFSTANE